MYFSANRPNTRTASLRSNDTVGEIVVVIETWSSYGDDDKLNANEHLEDDNKVVIVGVVDKVMLLTNDVVGPKRNNRMTTIGLVDVAREFDFMIV
jgi:hypothetical protein